MDTNVKKCSCKIRFAKNRMVFVTHIAIFASPCQSRLGRNKADFPPPGGEFAPHGSEVQWRLNMEKAQRQREVASKDWVAKAQ